MTEWQKVLGGLSYPIFLSHWLVGTLIALYLPLFPPLGAVHCGLTAVASAAFCLPIYFAVNQPIQKIRQSVKKRILFAATAFGGSLWR